MQKEITEGNKVIERQLIYESGQCSIVRGNLLDDRNYTGYCGEAWDKGCPMPRTIWRPDLGQFKCPHCGWVSQYPENFISYYRNKWNK